MVAQKLTAAFAITLACAASLAIAADWKPDKNVEIIVWSAPGGGLDRPARSMQKILQAATKFGS